MTGSRTNKKPSSQVQLANRKGRQQTLLLIAASVIVSGSLGAFVSKPLLDAVGVRKQESQQLQQQLDAENRLVGQLPSLRKQNKDLESQLSTAYSRFPSREQYSAVISSFYTLSAARSVELGTLSRSISASDIPGVDKLTVGTTLKGKYPQVMALVRDLQTQQRFMSIDALTLRADSGNTSSDVQISSYLLRKASVPGARQRPGGPMDMPGMTRIPESPAGTPGMTRPGMTRPGSVNPGTNTGSSVATPRPAGSAGTLPSRPQSQRSN